jgi:hypothetical protein
MRGPFRSRRLARDRDNQQALVCGALVPTAKVVHGKDQLCTSDLRFRGRAQVFFGFAAAAISDRFAEAQEEAGLRQIAIEFQRGFDFLPSSLVVSGKTESESVIRMIAGNVRHQLNACCNSSSAGRS